jgi:hypothetical protein
MSFILEKVSGCAEWDTCSDPLRTAWRLYTLLFDLIPVQQFGAERSAEGRQRC